MRCLSSLALLAGVIGASAALDEPAPLLKPVVPKGTGVRVRVATSHEKVGFYHIQARVPLPTGKPGATAAARAALEVRPGKSFVTARKWKSWGYEIPATKIGILPELVVPAVQVAPKPASGGRAVDVKFTGIRLEIVEPAANADTVLGCDLLLALNELTRDADRAFEPRLYFADQFLELTVAADALKRHDSGPEPPAPAVNLDSTLVPVAGSMTMRGVAVLSYAAINGQSRYRTPDGKSVPVNVTISSTTQCPGGVVVSMGVVRGCKIEVEEGSDLKGTGTTFETALPKGKLKELRIGLQTGPGFKEPKDLVLKDVTVWVDKGDSGHMMWIGPNFLREHLADPVYAGGADGAWKLYGRVKPDLLADIKTRPKKR